MKRILWTLGLMLVCVCTVWGGNRKKHLPERQMTPAVKRLYDYYYAESVKQKLLNRHDVAWSLLQYCRELNPDAGEALYGLGVYSFAMNEDSLGAALVEQAVAREPDNIWYREMIVGYYLNKNQLDKAQKGLEDMVRINPKRSDVMARLVGLYQNDDKYDKAIETLNRIEKLEGKSLEISLEKYWMYTQQKKMEQAYAELQALIDEYPNDLSYRIVLANQYLAQGDTARAKDIFLDVQQREPENQALHLALMDYALGAGNDSLYMKSLNTLLFSTNTAPYVRLQVMKNFLQAYADKPDSDARIRRVFDCLLADPNSDANIWMLYSAYLILRKDDQGKIARVLEHVLEMEPDNKMALEGLMKLYIGQQNYAGLVTLCTRGIQYYPDMMVLYYYKGLSLYQLDRKDEAVGVFEKAVAQTQTETDKTLLSDIFSILGDLYYQSDRRELAYAAYDSSLVYKRDNLSTLNNYAYFLSLENRELDKAQEMSYTTVLAEPDNVTYLDTYAWILFLKKNYAEAKAYMEKVVRFYEKEPENEEERLRKESIDGGVLEHAGDIYFQSGDPEKALRYWVQARRVGGDVSELLDKKIKQKKYIEP